ncbi:hypothetical protein OROMI_004787 [Orobanche minor]
MADITKRSTYCNLPRQRKKKTMDEKIQESVQKFVAEETDKILKQRDAFWGSPMIDSQQGSCSKGVDGNFRDLEKHGCVKKKLELLEEKNIENIDEKAEDVVKIGGKADEDEIVVKKGDQTDPGCLEWQLDVGNRSNVVAYATIETDVLGSAAIPFPVGDEIKTVNEAVGTYIAWPRNLISEAEAIGAPVVQAKKGVKKNAEKKWKSVKDCGGEYVVEIGADYPPALKRLWIWTQESLSDGRITTFNLCHETF